MRLLTSTEVQSDKDEKTEQLEAYRTRLIQEIAKLEARYALLLKPLDERQAELTTWEQSLKARSEDLDTRANDLKAQKKANEEIKTALLNKFSDAVKRTKNK